jgi:hypothetical protein
MDTWRLLVSDFLQIIGHDDAGDSPLGLGSPYSAVYQMAYLRGDRGRMNVLPGDVLKKRDQIHLLLVIATHCRTGLLTDNRHHALMVHFGIV